MDFITHRLIEETRMINELENLKTIATSSCCLSFDESKAVVSYGYIKIN